MLLTNQSFSQQAWWFSVGNVPPLGTKRYSLPLIGFNFFSRANIEQQECCVIFCDFSGFVWTFLCINWVFNAFYVRISKLKYKHMLQCTKVGWKSHVYPTGEFLGPMQEMGMNVKQPPRSLGRKHWDTWCLNCSKSKAHLKFMKLGMLSWSGINMPW